MVPWVMRVYVQQFDGIRTMNVLPLAAGLLVASARRDARLRSTVDFEIGTERDAPDTVIAAFRAPRVLALSLYTWNERYSLEIARRTRAAHPRCLIVVGGPSVPRAPDRARAYLEQNAALDVLAFGEGESTFKELLLAHLFGGDLRAVAGLALRDPDGHGVTFTPPRARLTAWEQTASPYLDGTFDRLSATRRHPFDAVVVETNRGCPFACTFCDWGQATQSRVHELPLARVEAELTWVAERRVPYLYIVDANFGIRRRDVGLLRHLAARKVETGYPFYCYFHLTKNATARNLETVSVLREAGIGCEVALSMQDFDPAVLAAVKRQNIKRSRALELRGLCNARGIATFNELLLGLPEQTQEGLRRSVVDAITPYPGDTFFLYPVRLLENAELASAEHRRRYGLVTRSCAVAPAPDRPAHVVEREEIVVATDAMPPDDWARAFRFGYLTALLHNLDIATTLHQALRECAGASLLDWLGFVDAAVAAAPDGTVLGTLRATLARYVEGVRRGEPLTRPLAGDPEGPPREAVEALLAVVLARHRDFYDALRLLAARFTAEDPVIDEACRYQAFATPAWSRRAPETASFTHDWPAFREAAGSGTTLARQPVQLRYTPPPHLAAAPGFAAFFDAHLRSTYAKQLPRCVEIRARETG